MKTEDTIHTINQVLRKFDFPAPKSFGEEFAQLRFAKKFEQPDLSKTKLLKEEAWFSFLERDRVLDKPDTLRLYPSTLYKTRLVIHELLNDLPSVSADIFPKGSEFTPTRGRNSIEARLALGDWSVTHDCFPLFLKRVMVSHGLRIAVKKRFQRFVEDKGYILKDVNSFLWKKLRDPKKIMEAKLTMVCNFVQGSRFSTVPKNNKVRRPINVEAFGNLIVQRHIGAQIREVIKSNFYDLDRLAEVHANRISNPNLATIDFSNASDSISLALVKFLVPKRFFKLISQARSSFILGPDDQYYPLNKVSSMGNGFTFELMSLILVAIARQFDPTASVFGDDVIIEKKYAEDFISVCTAVGFNVNLDKSFVDGPFRESCGANYHDGEGYIESYDFTWITNPGELVVTLNKLYRLARVYPSFKTVHDKVMLLIPKAMQRGPSIDLDRDQFYLTAVLENKRDNEGKPIYDFPSYIVAKAAVGEKITSQQVLNYLQALNYDPDSFVRVKGWKFVEKLRTPTTRALWSRQWAKYFMYLVAGKVTKDVVASEGKWVQVSFLVSPLLTIREASVPRDFCCIPLTSMSQEEGCDPLLQALVSAQVGGINSPFTITWA